MLGRFVYRDQPVIAIWVTPMEILFFLIPVTLIGLALIIRAIVWTVHSGQYDDLDGPAYRILFDDDDPRIPTQPSSRPTPQDPSFRK